MIKLFMAHSTFALIEERITLQEDSDDKALYLGLKLCNQTIIPNVLCSWGCSESGIMHKPSKTGLLELFATNKSRASSLMRRSGKMEKKFRRLDSFSAN